MMQEELTQPSMYCRQCGYALIGLSENRCPECGRAFDPADPRTFFRHPRSGPVRRWIKWIALALTVAVLSGAIFVAACFGWVYWQYHAGWQVEQQALAALRTTAGPYPIVNIRYAVLGSGPLYQITAPWDYLRYRVRRISVEGRPAHAFDLAPLAALKECTEVDLSHLGVRDDQLKPLEGLTQLEFLHLADNPAITDDGLVHLKGLTSLTCLYLGGTSVSGAGLGNLQGITCLRNLGLADTRVQGRDLTQLKAFPSLDVLELGGLLIADADLMHLKPLPLRYVNFNRTGITDAGLAEIGRLVKLECLELSSTAITDAGLHHLAGLASLNMLFLDDTAVTDAGLKHLEGLSNLGYLKVYGTKVTPEGIQKLKETLPSVHVLGP